MCIINTAITKVEMRSDIQVNILTTRTIMLRKKVPQDLSHGRPVILRCLHELCTGLVLLCHCAAATVAA